MIDYIDKENGDKCTTLWKITINSVLLEKEGLLGS